MYEGEKIVILGPSGSGKSTILRCINRLETMDDGIIIINDHDASIMKAHELRKDIGMVFQRFNIFSHMNVLENIMEAPVHVRHMNKNEVAKEARELLKKVGLSDKEDSMPSQLSGGQLQRVGIARALAMHPQILLFDDPPSALDPELVGEVLNVMKDIAKDGTSMIVVIHEMGFAREVADRILFMDGGVILANSTPEEFFTKQENPRIQSFEKLRTDGNIYVDKASYIEKLVSTGGYYLLYRPRRFGKGSVSVFSVSIFPWQEGSVLRSCDS